MAKSSRSVADLIAGLETWLAHTGSDRTIESVKVPEANGMSSETVMLTTTSPAGPSELVVRIAPELSDVPIFPNYDLELQHAVMALVGERSSVPVPTVFELETDPSWIGAPFFVMERVDGNIPSDIPPYVFEGWLLEAPLAAREILSTSTVQTIAELHSVAADEDVRTVLTGSPDALDGATALDRHIDSWDQYYRWVCGDEGIGLIDEGFAWLRANKPANLGEPVISWGDSRIGNVIYGPDHRPVAVLDWEMADLAPREVDLGWLCFMHTFFQDIAEMLEFEGLPGLFDAADVRATYEAAAGVGVADLRWFEAYASVRHGVIMSRVSARSVHFGERPAPADPVEAIIHADRLRKLIAD